MPTNPVKITITNVQSFALCGYKYRLSHYFQWGKCGGTDRKSMQDCELNLVFLQFNVTLCPTCTCKHMSLLDYLGILNTVSWNDNYNKSTYYNVCIKFIINYNKTKHTVKEINFWCCCCSFCSVWCFITWRDNRHASWKGCFLCIYLTQTCLMCGILRCCFWGILIFGDIDKWFRSLMICVVFAPGKWQIQTTWRHHIKFRELQIKNTKYLHRCLL